ncbi:MAG: hypothetical protein JRH20_02260 [Deltaproteobacteria bacterium]|nr:hypothetical protein [Deltaproteobacteria bacterium]
MGALEQRQPHLRSLKRALVLLVALCFFAPSVSLAYPAIPEGPTQPMVEESSKSPLLAKRRRRRGRRASRRTRRPRRASPVKKPKSTKEAFPTRDAPATATKTTAGAAPAADGALRRGARVEFDGRLVQGQTAKSGAIYLFARMRSELRSMVAERNSYRKEILRTVYPEEGK